MATHRDHRPSASHSRTGEVVGDEIPEADPWAYRGALHVYAEQLIAAAERLATMAERGQDRLALAVVLDIRLDAGQAVEVARSLVAQASSAGPGDPFTRAAALEWRAERDRTERRRQGGRR